MARSATIELNRNKFLMILRSGVYKKGTIRSDKNGHPIIKSKKDDNGHCVCAIMIAEFGNPTDNSTVNARKALGLTVKDCRFIQEELNDTHMSFKGIAGYIETLIFKRPNHIDAWKGYMKMFGKKVPMTYTEFEKTLKKITKKSLSGHRI